MKHLLIAILVLGAILNGCKEKDVIDTNVTEVAIGTQIWAGQNLNVESFRKGNLNTDTFINGDPIAQAKTNTEWVQAASDRQPAWCYYDNSPSNGEKYGRLYNKYAVFDSRGLAPNGWHIPSDAEWTTLENYLEGDAGTKMKSNEGWVENGNGTNSSGFSALPGGVRQGDGSFAKIGSLGIWWSSSANNPFDESHVWHRALEYLDGVVDRGFINGSSSGYSVRCLKD